MVKGHTDASMIARTGRSRPLPNAGPTAHVTENMPHPAVGPLGATFNGTGNGNGKNATAGEPISIVGFVDGLDLHDRLTGWAYIPLSPAQQIVVKVLHHGEMIALTLANLPRPDVALAGHGNGQCGFVVTLPPVLFDDEVHLLAITCEAPGAVPLSLEIAPTLKARPRAKVPVAAPTLRHDSAASPTARLGGDPAAAYVPGHYIFCTQACPRPVYHGSGWHEPEDEFTWIDGTEAIIEMTLRRPRDYYTFTLDLIPNMAIDVPQELTLYFNFLRIGSFNIPRPTVLPIKLPYEIFTLRKTSISLCCPNAYANTSRNSRDTRRLGLAVRSWCIS